MKKFLVLVGIFGAVVSAHASYLYWQVSDQDDNVSDATEWAGGYDTATVYAYTGTDKSTATAVTSGISLLGGESGIQSVDVSNFSSGSYSFYIELASSTYKAGSSTAVATSAAVTYESLATSGSIRETATLTDIPSVAVWHGSSYKAAPEPTSALLMLLGVAGLALKRKQRKLSEV